MIIANKKNTNIHQSRKLLIVMPKYVTMYIFSVDIS